MEEKKTIVDFFNYMVSLYPSYSQRKAIEAIFVAMLNRKPTILLLGPHATMKSSMILKLGSRILKPQATYTTVLDTSFKKIDALAHALNVDSERLLRNLVAGINVEYTQIRDTLYCKVEVNCAKYSSPEVEGWDRRVERVPLEVFTELVSTNVDPEEVFGYPIEHPTILGMKPPHFYKKRKATNADIVFLDEFYKNAFVGAQAHSLMNEKCYDSSLGRVDVDYVLFAAATNPFTQAYGTNIASLQDIASLDRFTVSAFVLPPETPNVPLVMEALKRDELNPKYFDVETILEARRGKDAVEVPPELFVYTSALLTSLDSCYFSLRDSERATRRIDPFSVNKQCNLCVYDGSTCSYGSASKTRPLAVFEETVKASAYIRGKSLADEKDLYYVLPLILQHRIKFNERKLRGDMETNTEKIVKVFSDRISGAKDHVKRIFDCLKAKDVKDLMRIRSDLIDFVEIRALIDEYILQIASAQRMKGEAKEESDVVSGVFDSIKGGVDVFRYET
jgi:hypothetical protein